MTRTEPIHRPVGPGSTADDVLAGLDLTGRVAVVTGGASGVGEQCTRALARAGARVVVPARDPRAARRTLDGVDRVEVAELDLADLASVERFADAVLAAGRPVDLLIASAGIMACPLTRVGPGWEAQFAVNHLGHHALVARLWPALVAGDGARVVTVATSGATTAAIRWDDVHFREGYDKWQAYLQSKAANVLFAAELDRRGRPAGVRAFSVSPGFVRTPLQRHLAAEEMIAAGWIDEEGRVVDERFVTPAQGAATPVWAATAPELAGRGGLYAEECTVVVDLLAGEASRPDDAARLWALSVELCGVDLGG
jgi:NAD(P)-dependent dehydrogenase (short-subunit alcohol dehydrogenase family)